MDAQAVKEFIAEKIGSARDLYAKDLEAIDEPRLAQSPAGVARAPFDFTYEVVFVNNRIAKRLRGEVPEQFDGQGWMTAPDEFKTKAGSIKALNESVDAVLEAWNALSAADLDKKIVLPSGDETSPIKMGYLAASHLNYHDAQLNYIQALTGDDEMHWE